LAVLLLQVPRKLIGTDGFQETPIVEVTRAITKHNYLVMDIADLPRVIKEVGGGRWAWGCWERGGAD
jgi:acetolactate synthase-1/2/3 large subunit